MLDDVVPDPGARSERALLRAHVDRLAAVVDAVGGPEAAAAAAGVADADVAALVAGDLGAAGALDVEVVAAVLALQDGAPAAGEIVATAREALLVGMTAGVMNVDMVAGDVGLDLEPREVQGMLEGRHPMSLRAYVALHRTIGRRAQ